MTDNDGKTQQHAGLVKLAAEFYACAAERGIKRIVFDMDRTLAAEHSQGVLALSELPSYASSLTQMSGILLKAAFSKQTNPSNIQVAVATFSDMTMINPKAREPEVAGRPLASALLRTVLSAQELKQVDMCCMNPDYHKDSLFPLSAYARCFDLATAENLKTAGIRTPRTVDKQVHLEWLSRHISDKSKVLLIDDSYANIEAAFAAGYQTIRVMGMHGLSAVHIDDWIQGTKAEKKVS